MDNPVWADGVDDLPNERWHEIPILADASMYMFFGKKGSGKSAVMASLGKDEAMNGKRVWYWPEDYSFKYGEPISTEVLYSLPDWLENGVLLVDEIQVLLNSLRTMSTANIMGSSMLQQIRKRSLNIYGTSNQPGRLDKTVSLQTDIHYFCEMIKDPRCEIRGRHLVSCDDHVRMRYVDTNMSFGTDPRYRDGRRRGMCVIWKIRDVYSIYNTRAIANMAEVMGMTKDRVLGQDAARKAGISEDEIIANLREVWIPWAVANGFTRITPAAFALALNEAHGLNLNRVSLGRALRALGLGAENLSQGRVVTLPPREQIDNWRAGVWSPD